VAAVVDEGRMPEAAGGRADVWVHPDSALAGRLRHRGGPAGRVRLRKVTARLEDKWQARGKGAYSILTMQPLGSGEPLDRELARALLRAGYAANLAEMLTLRSDAVEHRDQAPELVRAEMPVELTGVPFALRALDRHLKALCLPGLVRPGDGREWELAQGAPREGRALFRLDVAGPHDIRSWSFGEVKKPETINYRTFRPEPGGLFCERIFGPEKDGECACGKYRGMKHQGMICDRCGVKVAPSRVRRERMGHVELAVPVVHFWGLLSPLGLGALLGMKPADLTKVVHYDQFVVIDPGATDLPSRQTLTEEDLRQAREQWGDAFEADTGAAAVRALLDRLDPEREAVAVIEQTVAEVACPRPSEDVLRGLARRLQALEAAGRPGGRERWGRLVLECIPVLPPDLRPLVLLDNGNFATSDLNDHYRRVINRNNRLRKLEELKAPEAILRNERRMLQQTVDALFDNRRCRRPVLGSSNRPLRSLADVLGRMRDHLVEKRTDYSGRAVAVPGPLLPRGTVGLPRLMARELFHSLTGTAPPPGDRPVLVLSEGGRAKGLRPRVVDGEAVLLHPDGAAALGIGFTGDGVRVHVPLSDAAVRELSEPGPPADADSKLLGLRPGRLMRLALTSRARRLRPLDLAMMGTEGG
jgi:hypothetical protein